MSPQLPEGISAAAQLVTATYREAAALMSNHILAWTGENPAAINSKISTPDNVPTEKESAQSNTGILSRLSSTSPRNSLNQLTDTQQQDLKKYALITGISISSLVAIYYLGGPALIQYFSGGAAAAISPKIAEYNNRGSSMDNLIKQASKAMLEGVTILIKSNGTGIQDFTDAIANITYGLLSVNQPNAAMNIFKKAIAQVNSACATGSLSHETAEIAVEALINMLEQFSEYIE